MSLYMLYIKIVSYAGVCQEKNIFSRILSKINFIWQNFIEDMFGMGIFVSTYRNEEKKALKNRSLMLM